MVKNKRVASLVLASVLIAASIGLSSCGKTTYTIEIGAISWGVVKDDESLSTDIEMYPYKTYNFRYSFTYSVSNDNNGDLKFAMNVAYGNVDVIDASVKNINTGASDTISFTDKEGNNSKQGTYNFTAPDKSSKTGSVTLDVAYKAKKFGTTSTAITFTSANENMLIRGNGQDGITRGFTVNKIQLDVPVLTYTEAAKSLSWKNVDGATSYTIHVADTDVTAGTAEASLAYSVPEGTAAGTQLSLSVASYPSYFVAGHTYTVDIQALSSDVNYSTSSRSTAITVAL